MMRGAGAFTSIFAMCFIVFLVSGCASSGTNARAAAARVVLGLQRAVVHHRPIDSYICGPSQKAHGFYLPRGAGTDIKVGSVIMRRRVVIVELTSLGGRTRYLVRRQGSGGVCVIRQMTV